MSGIFSKSVRELGSQVPDFLHVCWYVDYTNIRTAKGVGRLPSLGWSPSNYNPFYLKNSYWTGIWLSKLNLAIKNSYRKGIRLSNIFTGHLNQAEHFRYIYFVQVLYKQVFPNSGPPSPLKCLNGDLFKYA